MAYIDLKDLTPARLRNAMRVVDANDAYEYEVDYEYLYGADWDIIGVRFMWTSRGLEAFDRAKAAIIKGDAIARRYR